MHFDLMLLRNTIFTSVIFLVWISFHAANAESMKSAVQYAIQTHPSGLSQLANSRAVAYELDAARRQFIPEVNIFGDIAGQNIHNPNSLSASDNGDWHAARQVGVSTSLLLFDGFERANMVYREASRLDAALYDVLSTTETVALSAVEAYIDVVRHRELLRIAKDNIRRHQNILRQIKERVSAGKSPASDSFQIEERVFAARAVMIEIEKANEDAKAKYRKVVGRNSHGSMKVPRSVKLPSSLEGLINQAIHNNFRIKAAQKVVAQNEYTRDATEGGLMPRVSVEGRASIGADRSGSEGEEREAYVGLKLSWKIFDGGVNDSRIGAAVERIGQSEYQVDLLRREVRETAQLSWNAYRDGRRRARLIAEQVNANKRIVKNYIEEYELSKRTLLDVLDAERALFNSRFQYIGVNAAAKFASYRMLASKSSLARHFGVATASLASSPDHEERFLNSTGRGGNVTGQSFFNIKIEPLQ